MLTKEELNDLKQHIKINKQDPKLTLARLNKGTFEYKRFRREVLEAKYDLDLKLCKQLKIAVKSGMTNHLEYWSYDYDTVSWQAQKELLRLLVDKSEGLFSLREKIIISEKVGIVTKEVLKLEW